MNKKYELYKRKVVMMFCNNNFIKTLHGWVISHIAYAVISTLKKIRTIKIYTKAKAGNLSVWISLLPARRKEY